MTLRDQLEADYKTALKAGERVRIDALRLIKAELQQTAIAKRKDALSDEEIVQVLSKQAKQRRETIESAKKAERQDILARATQELAILNSYLPQALSEEALQQLIEEAIAAVGSTQGAVMKYLMGKAAGAVDGKRASQLVAEKLKGRLQ